MTIELDLETVRAKAKELGVAYHPAQKAETIQFNIDAFLAAKQDAAAVEAITTSEPAVVPKKETPEEELARLMAEATHLIPVTVTSMDPQDANVTAAVISVGNAKLGQITKAIPFGFKWYMPKILVDQMEAQIFCRSAMVPAPGGTERVNTQWIKKYAIQYHPQPTPQELADLAKAQAVGNELAK